MQISHSTSSKNGFSDSTGRSQCDLFSNNECDWCGKKRLKFRRYDKDFFNYRLHFHGFLLIQKHTKNMLSTRVARTLSNTVQELAVEARKLERRWKL